MATTLSAHALSEKHTLELVQGDITAEQVGAIVNAANESLVHGGGVAAVIVRKGGESIHRESRAWVKEHGPVTHEQPAYTSAGELPAKYVIHAVGPVWHGGGNDEDTRLAAAVWGSLRCADQLKLKSMAFPAISTGILGYPKTRAAAVIFKAIASYFAENPDSGMGLVRIVLFDEATTQAFLNVWQQEFSEG